MCLLATKGSPKRLSKSVKQLVISPREHSRKPMRFIIILKIYLISYMLNYCKNKRKGWDSWGNQIDVLVTVGDSWTDENFQSSVYKDVDCSLKPEHLAKDLDMDLINLGI